MMNLDNALLFAYMVMEAAVICLLVYRRVWRLLPFFSIYCAWDLLSNIAVFFVRRDFPDSYLLVYLAETWIDATLQFLVLVELAWSVLRPIRASLPKYVLPAIAVCVLIAGAVIWPISGIHGQLQFSPRAYLLWHLGQTVSILRILFFLGLAACSQMLAIGWRDRELQVATGFGLYSLVSLGTAMMLAHGATSSRAGYLNQFVVASYICSLSYWAFSFAQQEAKRREFTPQMQNLLLAMAGVARSDRETLSGSSVTKDRDRNDR